MESYGNVKYDLHIGTDCLYGDLYNMKKHKQFPKKSCIVDRNTFDNTCYKRDEVHAIEITTESNSGELYDMLVYFGNVECGAEFIPAIRLMKIKQKDLLNKLVVKARLANCNMDTDIVLDGTSDAYHSVWAEISKYYENAAIVGDGLVNFEKFFFNATKKNSSMYTDYGGVYMSSDMFNEAVHNCRVTDGGTDVKVFLAHPALYTNGKCVRALDNVIENVRKEYDIDGIECVHPTANYDCMKYMINMCIKNGMYITGGTGDFGLRGDRYAISDEYQKVLKGAEKYFYWYNELENKDNLM